MPEAIELHDSKWSAVAVDGANTVLRFAPAYLHRWTERLGDPTHTGWLQETTLTFTDALAFPLPTLPYDVWDGTLAINGVLHEGLIPAQGTFTGPCELWLELMSGEKVTVRGSGLTIAPKGPPVYLESCTDRLPPT